MKSSYSFVTIDKKAKGFRGLGRGNGFRPLIVLQYNSADTNSNFTILSEQLGNAQYPEDCVVKLKYMQFDLNKVNTG